MPGLPNGLKPLEKLSGQINIIAGPNASGKTSTATAIRHLLWPTTGGKTVVEAMLQENQAPWVLRSEYGQHRFQRDGLPATLNNLPPADEAARYNFALQQLVYIDDRELAGKIYQEAMGGYNLGKAAATLQYSADIKKKNTGAHSDYLKAEAQLNEVTSKQRGIKDEEERLAGWIHQRKQSKAAAMSQGLYTAFINYKQALETQSIRNEHLATYPEQMSVMIGDELETLTALEARLTKFKDDLLPISINITDLRERLGELELPEKGVDTQLLPILEQRVEELSALEREINESLLAETSLKGSLEEQKASIYPGYDPGDNLRVDFGVIVGLDQWLSDAQQLLSQRSHLQVRIGQLQTTASPEFRNRDQIKGGMDMLSNWLTEQDKEPGVSAKWLWLMAVSACLTGISVLLWGWAGMSAMLLIVVLLILSMRKPLDQRSDVRRQDYQSTGLPLPSAWQPGEISTLFQDLSAALQKAERFSLEQDELGRLNGELADLQPHLEKLNHERDRWLQQLGHAPELPQGDLKNYSGLFWYIKQLEKLCEQTVELAALQGKRSEMQRHRLELLEAINDLLRPYHPRIVDGTTTKAALKILTDKVQMRDKLLLEIRGQLHLQETKQMQSQEAKQAIEAIYQKFAIAGQDKQWLIKLTEQFQAYHRAETDFRDGATLLREKYRILQDQPGFGVKEAELATMDLQTAQSKLNEASAEADRYEGLNTQIIATETRVQEKRAAHDLEKALMDNDAALDHLQQAYENNLASLTGSLLVSLLRKESGQSDSSAVLQRGNKLFNQITNGRYELRINDLEQKDFWAYDNTLLEGQTLEQLSSGTRIQLLLSIRLAYIESQEEHYQVPIIADELLGNSDDERAEQIIQALANVAAEGRQVFYFTAQKEEVAKWQAYAAAHPECQVNTYVIGSRDVEDYLRQDAARPICLSFYDDIPPCADHTHNTYQAAIGVPAYQLMLHHPEQLHLWYLLENLTLLVDCLEKRIKTYAQLKSYLNHGGSLEGCDEALLERMSKKVELLSTYQELYQIGRPKRIDVEVLKQSQALKGDFIVAVSDLLKSVDYDPDALIKKLNSNAIAKFRTASKEKLVKHLYDEGYLSEEAIIEETELLQRLQVQTQKLGLALKEAEDFLKLINRVPVEAA